MGAHSMQNKWIEKQEAKTNLVAKMSNELSWYCFMVKDACKNAHVQWNSPEPRDEPGEVDEPS